MSNTTDPKSALVKLGLTEAIADKLIDGLGLETVADFVHLTEDDLKEAGLKPIPARRFLANVRPEQAPTPTPTVAAPAAPTPPIHITASVVTERDVFEMRPRELIAIIGDGTHDDREEAANEWDRRTHGRPAIVAPNGALDQAESLKAFRKAAGGGVLTFWAGSIPVKTARQFVGLKEFTDPMTGEELNSGHNDRTLADWSGVTMDRMILVAYAQRQGMLQGKNGVEVAEAMKAEALDGFWMTVQKRLDAVEEDEPGVKGRIKKSLERDKRGFPSHVPVTPPPIVPHQSSGNFTAGSQGGSQIKVSRVGQLTDLLQTLFPMDNDLRIFLTYNATQGLVNSLPAGDVSLAEYASAAAQALESHGFTSDEGFYTALVSKRPGRADIIRAAAARFGVRL